jgi:hypothetical protein
MPDPRISTAIYLLPGMSAELGTSGYFVATGKRKIEDENGETKEVELVQGFAVQDDDTGVIEPVSGKPAVVYKHKKFSMNKIYFFARTGEIGIVDVISVPIHDHSSIVTGGPAYGTYFTDDETIDE